MKKILLSVSLFLSAFTFSQTVERKSLYKGSFDITQKIIDGKDTITYLYYGYTNMKYQHISDYGGFLISTSEDALNFQNELLAFSEKEKGISISKSFNGFSLELFDFSDKIYIFDKDRKYTTITKAQAKKMVKELSEQQFLLK